ncbi:alpha/beta hydrolase [Phycicoccus flavus]|uniref:alpha/beta hydrolase n=1 Tax=Phycicoccus flavus TaxID=2502783 RepID=UPI000FEB87BD|nr:alpha/beta fold hydrolase [Phycicoccus flavus]NHA69899.1 alpha/beta hydrolase [Phycicoccus flavus]
MSEPEAAGPVPARRRRRSTVVLAGALAVVVVLAVLLFTPVLDDSLDVQMDPASSYEDALRRADALRAQDGPDVNPVCRSRVDVHGSRTPRAVVLLHGYTNCPAQFAALADAYAAAGWSVVVPRLPGQGEADRLTDALSSVTPGALVDTAEEAADIAAGLGERVSVVGLSGGGTLAAWLAAERDDVAEATLIAPLVVPRVLPEFGVGPVSRAFRYTPDVFLWWDPAQKERLADPPYAYPRYSLRSIGAYLAVGRAAQQPPRRKTRLERLVVVTNENDAAVSNVGVDRIGAALTLPGVEREDVVIPRATGWKHDLVDPQGENAAVIPQIYARLGPLVGLPDLARPAT